MKDYFVIQIADKGIIYKLKERLQENLRDTRTEQPIPIEQQRCYERSFLDEMTRFRKEVQKRDGKNIIIAFHEQYLFDFVHALRNDITLEELKKKKPNIPLLKFGYTSNKGTIKWFDLQVNCPDEYLGNSTLKTTMYSEINEFSVYLVLYLQLLKQGE